MSFIEKLCRRLSCSVVQKHSSNMDFTRNSKIFLSFFYYIGISPYQPQSKKMICKALKLSNVFFILQSAVTISLAISCIAILDSGGYSSMVMNSLKVLILYINSACEIVRTMFILTQCLTNKHLIFEFIYTVYRLDTYFLTKMKYRIPYQLFRRQYLSKILMIFGGLSQYLSTFIIRCFLYYCLTPTGVQLRFFHCMRVVTILHIIFYIDLVCFHLSHLNAIVLRDIDQFKNINVKEKLTIGILKRNKIKCYKHVHFRLWQITQRLNVTFGWIMIAILLQIFVDFIYSAFWLFEEFHLKSSYLRVFRMFYKLADG